MMNDNCCAMPMETRQGIGEKAKHASEMLEAALTEARGIQAFLFTSAPNEDKTPVANCLDEELNVICDKAGMLANILGEIRGRL